MEKLSFPNRITVEITNRCNVSCTFCNRQKIDMELGDMEPALFYKIVDEAAAYLPVKLVVFFRGESLMSPYLTNFIKYAKEKGLGPIQLASNALVLDDKMSDELIDTGIDFISFSLDTIDKEIYRCSRLSGDLEISMQHVEAFGLKCKERKLNGLFAPKLQVSTIDLDVYKSTQKEFIHHWECYVDIVRVYYEHDEKGHLVDSEVQKELGLIKERKPCRKVFTDMIIYWNGKIALCNYDWDEKREIGDVSKTTLLEAWNSDEFEKIREKHLLNKFEESEICSDCHHWKIDYTQNGYLGKVYKSEV